MFRTGLQELLRSASAQSRVRHMAASSPPSILRRLWALAITAAGPTSSDPAGAARPFDKQKHSLRAPAHCRLLIITTSSNALHTFRILHNTSSTDFDVHQAVTGGQWQGYTGRSEGESSRRHMLCDLADLHAQRGCRVKHPRAIAVQRQPVFPRPASGYHMTARSPLSTIDRF